MDKSSDTAPRHIRTGPASSTIFIRGHLKSGTAAVLILLGMATLGGLLFVTVSPRAEANPRNSVAVLLSTAAVLAAAAAVFSFRVEQLTIDRDHILQRKSLAGVPWMRRQMARADVDALRVQPRGPGGRGLAIVGRQGRLLLGSSLAEDELEWLRDWVAQRLGRSEVS
jgi:hypothetical protein